MTLLSVSELAVWVGEEIALDDPRALLFIEAASDVVRSAAGQPDWDRSTAPPRAKQIAGHLASRSYQNPTSVLAEGGIGPLGGDRGVEELAKALHLTAAERAELERLGGVTPGGGAAGSSSLWVQPLDGSNALEPGDVYVADDSGSDWMIPYFASEDVG